MRSSAPSRWVVLGACGFVLATSPCLSGRAEAAPASGAERATTPHKARKERKRKSDKARFRELVREAEVQFVNKKYADALSVYEEAYATRESDLLIYMMARCHEELEHYEQALELFDRFLLLEPSEAEAVAKAQTRAHELREALKIGTLVLQVSPFGADVSLNGEPVGVAPLSPLEVTPGRHEIVVRMAGYGEKRVSGDVLGARQTTLALSLERVTRGVLAFQVEPFGAEILVDGQALGEAPQDAIEVEEGPHEIIVRKPGFVEAREIVRVTAGENQQTVIRLLAVETKLPMSTVAWSVGGVAVALGIAGTVAYALGESDHQEVTNSGGEAIDRPSTLTQRQAQALIEDGDAKKMAGYILWGVGGAALVSSAVLFAIAPGDDARTAVTIDSVSAGPCRGGFCIGAAARF